MPLFSRYKTDTFQARKRDDDLRRQLLQVVFDILPCKAICAEGNYSLSCTGPWMAPANQTFDSEQNLPKLTRQRWTKPPRSRGQTGPAHCSHYSTIPSYIQLDSRRVRTAIYYQLKYWSARVASSQQQRSQLVLKQLARYSSSQYSSTVASQLVLKVEENN